MSMRGSQSAGSLRPPADWRQLSHAQREAAVAAARRGSRQAHPTNTPRRLRGSRLGRSGHSFDRGLDATGGGCLSPSGHSEAGARSPGSIGGSLFCQSLVANSVGGSFAEGGHDAEEEQDVAERIMRAADRRSRDGQLSIGEVRDLLNSGVPESRYFRGFLRWLEANFAWLDEDQGGTISMAELSRAVAQYLRERRERQIQQEVRSLRKLRGVPDTEGDEAVRLAAEMMTAANKLAHDNQLSIGDIRYILRSTDEQRFDQFRVWLMSNVGWFDSDQGTKVSIAELQQAVAQFLDAGHGRFFDSHHRHGLRALRELNAARGGSSVDDFAARIMVAADARCRDGQLTVGDLDSLDADAVEGRRFGGFLRWLKANFRWWDRDHSGTISMRELREAIESYLDNGQVDQEMRAMREIRVADRLPEDLVDLQVDKLAAQIILAADRMAHNGELSTAELEALLQAGTRDSEHFSGFLGWLKANFRWLDTDYTGTISVSELRRAFVAFLNDGKAGALALLKADAVDSGQACDATQREEWAACQEAEKQQDMQAEMKLALDELDHLHSDLELSRVQSRSLRLEVVWTEESTAWSKERAARLERRSTKWASEAAELRSAIVGRMSEVESEWHRHCQQKMWELQDLDDERDRLHMERQQAELAIEVADRARGMLREECDAVEDKLQGPGLEVHLKKVLPALHAVLPQLERTEEAEGRLGEHLEHLAEAAQDVRARLESFARTVAEAQKWTFPPELRQLLDDPRSWGWDLSSAVAEWLSTHLRRVEAREREFMVQQAAVQKVLGATEEDLGRLKLLLDRRLQHCALDELDPDEVLEMVRNDRVTAETACKKYRESARTKRVACVANQQQLVDLASKAAVLRRQLQTAESRVSSAAQTLMPRRPGPPALAAASEAKAESLAAQRDATEVCEVLKAKAVARSQAEALEAEVAEQHHEATLARTLLNALEMPTPAEQAFVEGTVRAIGQSTLRPRSFHSPAALLTPLTKSSSTPFLRKEYEHFEETDEILQGLHDRVEKLMNEAQSLNTSDCERFSKDRTEVQACSAKLQARRQALNVEHEHERIRLAGLHGERAQAESRTRSTRVSCGRLASELEDLGTEHRLAEAELFRYEAAADEIAEEYRESQRKLEGSQEMLQETCRRRNEAQAEHRRLVEDLEDGRGHLLEKTEGVRTKQESIDEFAGALEEAASNLDGLRAATDMLAEGLSTARDRLDGIAKTMQAAGEALGDAEAWGPSSSWKLGVLGLTDFTRRGLALTPGIGNGGRIRARVISREQWTAFQEVLSDTLVLDRPFELEGVKLLAGCKLLPIGRLAGYVKKRQLADFDHDWGPDFADPQPLELTFEGPGQPSSGLAVDFGEGQPESVPNVAMQVERLEAVANAMGEAASGLATSRMKQLLERLEGIARFNAGNGAGEQLTITLEKLRALDMDASGHDRAVEERAQAWREAARGTAEVASQQDSLIAARQDVGSLELSLGMVKAEVHRLQSASDRAEQWRRKKAAELALLEEGRRSAERRCDSLREELGEVAGEAQTLQAWLRHSATDPELSVSLPQWVLPGGTTVAKDVSLATGVSMTTQLAAASPLRRRGRE